MEDNTDKPNSLNNPHDKFFKAAFGMLSVVQGSLIQFIPKSLFDKIDINSLEIDSDSYITEELSEFYADLVWRCRFKESQQKAKFVFLFEHKSYKPSYPHFQIMDYERGMWRKLLAAQQELIPIVPIIVYHGKDPWLVKSFDSYFGEVDSELLRFMPCFDYILINLQDYPDDVINGFHSILLQKTCLAFKHYWDTQYIKNHIVDLWLLGYPNQKDEQILGFIRFFGVYLTSISGITHQEIIAKVLYSDNNKKSEAMTIIDEFVHEGIEKGIEKGIERSIINAWKNGLTPELIAKYLDYPLPLILKTIANYKLEIGLK